MYPETNKKSRRGNIENTPNAAFWKVIDVRTVSYKPAERQMYLKCLVQ